MVTTYVGGGAPSNQVEACFEEHASTAWEVIHELALALEVTVAPFPEEADGSIHVHCSGDVGFDPRAKEVYYGDEGDPEVILLLPHEIIHAVWPDSELLESPEEEWDCGMIHYELAWLERLCEGDEARQECLKQWHGYASEGDRGVYDEDFIKTEVEDMDIPNPWEEEL